MKSENILWKFFSSVKLALFTLCCLAITSIIGTIIPQKESAEFYSERYGNTAAQFFSLFDIGDMYTAWWFLALLGLLSTNLIICSLDRFPLALRRTREDGLQLPLERICKISTLNSWPVNNVNNISDLIAESLREMRWSASSRVDSGVTLFFSQKGAYSRLGVYIVHISILVIFAGAIYGQLTGFRGGIMLPEQQTSETVFPYDDSAPIPLDFEVKCERFDIEFYLNGAPKLFRSKLTLIKDGKIVAQKDIEVNTPLTFEGITFYQSSYQSFRDFIFQISINGQNPHYFSGDFQKEIQWDQHNIRFGVLNLEAIRDRVTRVKIWYDDDRGDPIQFWMENGNSEAFERDGQSIEFSAKQRYATGLQVAKDPGVWIVYIGCGLMLLGLYMAFFLSHQRIWLLIHKEGDKTRIELKGTANKNKAGFEKTIDKLAEMLHTRLSNI